MNGRQNALMGLFLGVLSFILNRPYISLTLFLSGYTFACKENDGWFVAGFFASLMILYNLRIYGLL